jgi:hypothetical protein
MYNKKFQNSNFCAAGGVRLAAVQCDTPTRFPSLSLTRHSSGQPHGRSTRPGLGIPAGHGPSTRQRFRLFDACARNCLGPIRSLCRLWCSFHHLHSVPPLIGGRGAVVSYSLVSQHVFIRTIFHNDNFLGSWGSVAITCSSMPAT